MTTNRVHYVLLAAAAILLLLGLAHQHAQVRETIKQAWGSDSSDAAADASSPEKASPQPPPPTDPSLVSNTEKLPTFHEIALKYGTDKVTDHQYWFMYDKYFPALRNQRVKMLEIGLGCDMVCLSIAGIGFCIVL
jgi:hypothetical protein